jgi:FkbM family methyltransferase
VSFHFRYRAYRARWFRQAGEIRAVLAHLEAGDTAFDVGAHKGRYTYWMRRAVGPGGRVVAFEPQPRLAADLQAAVTRLGWRNVAVRPCAVGDAVGSATLHVPGARGVSAGASLDSAAYAAGAPLHLACEVTTLDRESEGPGRVALVKVDVEGHEWQVFQGAERLLRRDAPVLLFECEQRHLKDRAMADVFAWLEGLGYEGAFFAPVALRPLAAFDPAVHQPELPGRSGPYCNNFLFTRRR